MTKKERMVAALCHQPVDRIPRGELGIEGGFIANFFKDTTKPMSALEKEIAVREQMGMDFVDIHEFPRKLLGYADDGYPIYQSPFRDVFKETPHSFQMLKPALEDIEDVAEYETADLSTATTHLLDFYKKNTDFFSDVSDQWSGQWTGLVPGNGRLYVLLHDRPGSCCRAGG